MDARISLLFLSMLVHTSNSKYYSKTTKYLCNRKGPTHGISFNVKHQLAKNLRLNSFWLLDCQTKTDEYIDKFPICESQEAMENLVEKKRLFRYLITSRRPNWQDKLRGGHSKSNGSKVVSVTHFKMAILDHESIVNAQFFKT